MTSTWLAGRPVALRAPDPDEFYLPPLPRLLPVAYHPQATRIEITSNGWVRWTLGDCFDDEQSLLAFLRQRNGIYGPITVPYADAARAQNIADWYQFVTVIDSLASDESALGADHTVARETFAAVMAVVGATAAELLHLASLVHDDNMDEAPLRHRVGTINARAGTG